MGSATPWCSPDATAFGLRCRCLCLSREVTAVGRSQTAKRERHWAPLQSAGARRRARSVDGLIGIFRSAPEDTHSSADTLERALRKRLQMFLLVCGLCAVLVFPFSSFFLFCFPSFSIFSGAPRAFAGRVVSRQSAWLETCQFATGAMRALAPRLAAMVSGPIRCHRHCPTQHTILRPAFYSAWRSSPAFALRIASRQLPAASRIHRGLLAIRASSTLTKSARFQSCGFVMFTAALL